MKLKVTSTKRKSMSINIVLRGIVKYDGMPITINITHDEFRFIKKHGNRSYIVLKTIEGAGHIEYWELSDFSSYVIEVTKQVETVQVYKTL